MNHLARAAAYFFALSIVIHSKLYTPHPQNTSSAIQKKACGVGPHAGEASFVLSCVPVLYFVGVADYGAALMEQQAHHGKHTALDQYSKQPVPRYQVAACQAGQQGGGSAC